MYQLRLNFYHQVIEIKSNWLEIIELLSKDFSFFKENRSFQSHDDSRISLSIFHTRPNTSQIPEICTSMQSLNSLTYQVGNIRYNDYYGKLLSVFDYKNEKAEMYSEDLSKTHEVAYLFILSRIGKKLDVRGLHKLHAFAVAVGDVAVVCMMPMKGGKSTLMLELLKDPSVKMISDDIPFVNRLGEILPCPIKIGLDDWNSSFEIFEPEKNIYEIDRELYGRKKLICLEGLPGKIVDSNKKYKKVILIEAFRYNSLDSMLIPSAWTKTFKGLFKHGVIGFGLPMVIEYFWEFGPIDFLLKAFIFCSRFWSFFILSLRADKYKVFLGKKPELAAKEILKKARKSE